METTVGMLQNVMDEQKSVYAGLLSLAESQREALLARDNDTLAELAPRQSKMVCHLMRLEDQGKAALAQIAAGVGMAGNSASLTAVAPHMEPSQAKPLLECREQIVKLATRLSQVNRINAELFETAMESIRFTLKLLAGSRQAPNPCYPGSSSNPAASLMVDSRA